MTHSPRGRVFSKYVLWFGLTNSGLANYSIEEHLIHATPSSLTHCRLAFFLLYLLQGSLTSSRKPEQDAWVWHASAGLSALVVGPALSNPELHTASWLFRQLLTSWSFSFHADWTSRHSVGAAWTLPHPTPAAQLPKWGEPIVVCLLDVKLFLPR